jgi:hypothetical protein
MNATTKAIIEALPKKPILIPAEIAAAYGLASSNPILADIKTGKLAANVINGRYLISREAAEKYIKSNEYEPEEGTL